MNCVGVDFFGNPPRLLRGRFPAMDNGSALNYQIEDGMPIRCVDGVCEPWDFNAEYEGFYPRCRFTAALSAGGQHLLAGMDETGQPHLFASILGNVWEERSLTAQQPMAFGQKLTEEIGWIIFQEEENQYLLICRNGQVAVLPDCPKCLRILSLKRQDQPETVLKNAAAADGKLQLLWEDGVSQVLPLSMLRQYRASFGFARQWLARGGVLIDLRTVEDAAQQPEHIYLHADEVEHYLESQPKDRPMFFLCETGRLADGAADAARKKGYRRAYSLGGSEEWAHVE